MKGDVSEHPKIVRPLAAMTTNRPRNRVQVHVNEIEIETVERRIEAESAIVVESAIAAEIEERRKRKSRRDEIDLKTDRHTIDLCFNRSLENFFFLNMNLCKYKLWRIC